MSCLSSVHKIMLGYNETSFPWKFTKCYAEFVWNYWSWRKPSHSSVMGITRNLYDKCRVSGKPVFLTFNFLFLILFEPFTSGKINYNEKRSMSSSSFRDWLFRCPYSWQYSVVSLTSSLSPFWGCIWHATLPLFLITQKIHSFPL